MTDPDDLRRRIWKHTADLAKRCESPAGWRVFRYTSDEVFHNPFAVAHEILEITRAVIR